MVALTKLGLTATSRGVLPAGSPPGPSSQLRTTLGLMGVSRGVLQATSTPPDTITAPAPLVRVVNKRNPYLIDFDNPFNADNPWGIPAPVAWWQAIPTKMGGTVFHDLMGNHNGTLTDMDPATDWVTDSPVGGWGSLEFPAGRVDVNGVYSGLDFSLAVVARSTGSGISFLFNKDNGGVLSERGWQFRQNGNNTLTFLSIGNGPIAYSSRTINDGNWHMFAATIENGIDATLFIDSEQDVSVSGLSQITTGTDRINLGGYYTGGSLWQGNIAAAFFFHQPLSGSQHAALYEESLNYYPNLLNRKKIFPIGGETFHWVPSITGNHTDVISGNDGTPSGGVSIVRDREKGGVQAAEFDGTGTGVVDHGSIGSVFDGGSTISMWVKRDGNPASQEDLLVLENVNDTFNHMTWSINTNGTLYVWYSENTPSMVMFSRTTSQSICDGEWHSISVVLDIAGNDMTIYVDGEISADASDSTMGTASGASDPVNLSIGSFSYVGCCATLDDHRVFQRLLTLAEIKELYKRGYQRRYAETHLRPVLAIHPSEDKFGAVSGSTVALDLSGNGNLPAMNQCTYVNDSEHAGRKALYIPLSSEGQVSLNPAYLITAGSDLTFCCWFKRDAAAYSGPGGFWRHNDIEQNLLFALSASDTFHFRINGTNLYGSQVMPNATEWNHICVRLRNAHSVEFFVNGELFESITHAIENPGASLPYYGKHYGAQRLVGWHDSICFYDYALNESEIRLLAGSRTAKYIEPEDGLIAWYCPSQDPGSVANNTTPLNLVVGNESTVTFSGGTTYDEANTNKSGDAAFDLDGVANYMPIDFPLTAEDTEFTFSCWAYARTLVHNATIIQVNDNPRSLILSYRTTAPTNSFSVQAFKSSGVPLTDNLAVANQWQHLVVTGNNVTGEVSFYIDGVLVGTVSNGTHLWDPTSGTTQRFGLSTTGQYFDGLIDNVKIYNRVLFPREIEKQYQMERPGVPVSYNQIAGEGLNNTKLLHHWRAQENTGTNFGDDAGENDGTLTGTWESALVPWSRSAVEGQVDVSEIVFNDGEPFTISGRVKWNDPAP